MDRTKDGQPLRDDLKNYDSSAYEKPSVTVDICICSIPMREDGSFYEHDKNIKVLMIQRGNPPFRDLHAIPGGFLEIPKKETLEETADRELLEETHLRGFYIEQLKTYGDPDRDPRTRVITVAYYALVPWTNYLKGAEAGDDAKPGSATWQNLRYLPAQLAFDHKKILKDLLIRLEGKVSYTPIAFNFLPKKFTWGQLQTVYEIILNRKLITPNFRRKIRSMYEFKELKETQPSSGRPSRLMKFVREKKML
jgi:8-oxo-dGTP diphosphatase